MTDQTMTHEQALADALDNLVHDNYERSYRGSQERKADADLIRAALSRPAVPAEPEKWRKMAEGAIAFVDGGCVKTSPLTAEAHIKGLAQLLLTASSAPAPAVPEGYKLVPIEPTSAMKTAGCGVEVYQDSPAELEALTWEEAAAIWRAMLAAAPEPAEQHPDDAAVDQFAQVMKAKLAKARAKGRSGWDDPAQCSPEYLADLLAGHVRKGNDGNFVDVANLAMMLHQRGAAPSVMPDAIRRSAAEESLGDASEPVYRLTIRDDRSDVIDACPALLDLDPGHYELHARPESAEGDSE